jgi:hypothetical protein
VWLVRDGDWNKVRCGGRSAVRTRKEVASVVPCRAHGC